MAARLLPPLWVRHASATCAPIVFTGFSEYFGSCRMKPARLPRIPWADWRWLLGPLPAWLFCALGYAVLAHARLG